ncbi:hypothetical protein TEA_007628 [Camellia sinensis var. sinensis]|uniref:Uncharacterized protein n=1 Tax=Camellia sinensis var. sinensis TaxID=542762 RepID=A0A4S4DRL9_CAMSN|nr:hypothetical protein TEA_007628 [Camellia sinensis var. sinensis]
MEKYFGNAYRGDPGVPHADPDRFVNIWIGSFAFSALTWVNPYMWQLSNQFKFVYFPDMGHFEKEFVVRVYVFPTNFSVSAESKGQLVTLELAICCSQAVSRGQSRHHKDVYSVAELKLGRVGHA